MRPAAAGPRRIIRADTRPTIPLPRMHQMSPTFAKLEKRLARHLRSYVKALEFDMEGRELAMTDCWVNIMPKQVVHGLHLHPLSTISGTYYVRTPKGCSGIKFEDPRLERFMAAPPRKADCAAESSVDRGAGGGGQARAVRELAAARSGAESGECGAGEHQFQLQLVLRSPGSWEAASSWPESRAPLAATTGRDGQTLVSLALSPDLGDFSRAESKDGSEAIRILSSGRGRTKWERDFSGPATFDHCRARCRSTCRTR